MEKENKVKKFFKENREVIAAAAGCITCAALGAVIMYNVNRDSIKLGNALDKFKSKQDGKNDLLEHMTKHFGASKDIIYDGGIHNQNCTDYGQKLIEQGALTPDKTVGGLYALIIKK